MKSYEVIYDFSKRFIKSYMIWSEIIWNHMKSYMTFGRRPPMSYMIWSEVIWNHIWHWVSLKVTPHEIIMTSSKSYHDFDLLPKSCHMKSLWLHLNHIMTLTGSPNHVTWNHYDFIKIIWWHFGAPPNVIYDFIWLHNEVMYDIWGRLQVWFDLKSYEFINDFEGTADQNDVIWNHCDIMMISYCTDYDLMYAMTTTTTTGGRGAPTRRT